jgi:acyl carrier protein
MNDIQILEDVTKIIRDVLELPDLNLKLDTSAEDVDEWDSMTHMQLIAAIEDKYKIRFALGELQTLKNVGDMIQMIRSKINI